jgi:pimeloyl-ACP methyl ester carboxylesterase
MTNAARERLAAEQAEVVRALVAQGPLPVGFHEARFRAFARSLVNKRRQALVRAWPSLIRVIGKAYPEKFTSYAETHPLPEGASTLADGREFLRWLEPQGPPSDAARLEAFAFDLRWKPTALGLSRRGGFAVKLLKLRETPTLVIAARLPWLGERWLRVPLGKRGK